MSTINLANRSDGHSILRITANTNIFKPTEQDCVVELWHEYLDKKLGSSYIFLVYREKDAILGYACYGLHALTQGTFDLYWIAVDPVAQGRGIGQELLHKVEQSVRDQNGRMLLIETSSARDYRVARHFYRHNGYKRVAQIPNFYEQGDDLLIYYKRIKPKAISKHVELTSETSFLDSESEATSGWWERKKIW